MGLSLYRIDDRMIHGQVVVGWGQPLGIRFIVMVDDAIAVSEWEQDLYRMAVPPGVEVHFADVQTAASHIQEYQKDPRPGLLLTGDIATMHRVIDQVDGSITTINLGGIHCRSGRHPCLRYVYLTPDEEADLRAIADHGVTVTAQDVPTARPVPLSEILGHVHHDAR